MSKSETTKPTLASYGLPEHPTDTDRAQIGCYHWPPGDYSGCWCGYHCVDGRGCCPQCISLGRSFSIMNIP